MIKKTTGLIVFLIFSIGNLIGQGSDNWDVYIAQYEKGPGSTIVNMSLIERAPIPQYNFVVVTGVTFSNCDSAGFPAKGQFDDLYKISDSVQKIISGSVKSVFAGTFTHQCQRLDYIYVHDTAKIRSLLNQFYKTSFSKYDPYINIVEDKKWEGYLSFLYPSEETQEYMSNQKVVTNLEKSGDKLVKSRKVDHWLYFKNDADRNCMIKYAKGLNFVVEKTDVLQQREFPFSLQISREDKVDVSAISNLTLSLRKQAHKCNGVYDGWETFVVK